MIDSLITYVRQEVFPRYHRILFTTHPWLGAVGAIAFADGYIPVADDVQYFDIASPLLTYNTVVIGFCVTSIAICFTFSKRFSSVLCRQKDSESGISAYEDLVFVFSWTSLVHMVSLLYILVCYVVYGNFKLEEVISRGFNFSAFIFIFMQFYSLMQFFVSIITVHQVAKLYSKLSAIE